MFVQSHFQRARHQAAPPNSCSSSSSASASTGLTALATQLHHSSHHQHHHHHHHNHQRQSTWSSGSSSHANDKSALKPIEKRKSRLSSASSSVNSRDLLLVQTVASSSSSSSSSAPASTFNSTTARITANGHSAGKANQPTSCVPSIEARPQQEGPRKNQANDKRLVQQTSQLLNRRRFKFKSRSLSSLVDWKQANSLKGFKKQEGDQEEQPASGARTNQEVNSQSKQTSEQPTSNGISQQDRRHLLWRKLILDCSLKLGHLLTGKLFVSQPTTTTTSTSGQTTTSTTRSVASTRRANFQLISSFCMSFIHYQLETWRLLVDGATSAHYHNNHNSTTNTGHKQQLHRQTSLNLPATWQPAPPNPEAEMATSQWQSVGCCSQFHERPEAETVDHHHHHHHHQDGHKLVDRVPNNSSHLLLLPNHSHSPLQLRHTVDGSPISAHHYQGSPHRCFYNNSNHGHLIAPGGRSIGGPGVHNKQHTLSSPTLADEVRQAEWRTQQAHLHHQHHHHPNNHHHRHQHNHNHNHGHNQQGQPNNQVRQTSTRAEVAASEGAQHQMLTRTQTEDISGFQRRRLAQDYGLLVDYGGQTGGGSGGLIGSMGLNKLSPMSSMRNTYYSYEHQMPTAANSDHHCDSRRNQTNTWLSSKPTNNKWNVDGRTSQTGSVASSLAGSVHSAHSRLMNGSSPQGKQQHLQSDHHHHHHQRATTTTSQSLSGKSSGSFISTSSSCNKRTAANHSNGSNSNSLTKVSLAGAKRRLGFKLKGGHLSSLNVHRSEEVLPADVANNNHHHQHLHHFHQYQSYSINRSSPSPLNNSSAATTTTTTTVNSFNTSTDEMSGSAQNKSSTGKRQWLSVNWQQPTQVNGHNNQLLEQQLLDPRASFVEGLGAGQIASRQALVSPYLGDIQLSLSDQRGMLEVEVIRVRQLQAKPSAKRLPSPYVKVYLMKEKKCVAKFKTIQMSWTLDAIYQQRFIFRDDYTDCVLQVIVWGDYGKRDRKSLMGLAQIHLNDLDMSNVVIGWYKLFNAPSLTSSSSLSMSSSKQLRQTISATKVGQQQQPLYNESIEDNNDKQEANNDDDDDDDDDSEQEELDNNDHHHDYHNSYTHGGHANLDNDMYTSK